MGRGPSKPRDGSASLGEGGVVRSALRITLGDMPYPRGARALEWRLRGGHLLLGRDETPVPHLRQLGLPGQTIAGKCIDGA